MLGASRLEVPVPSDVTIHPIPPSCTDDPFANPPDITPIPRFCTAVRLGGHWAGVQLQVDLAFASHDPS